MFDVSSAVSLARSLVGSPYVYGGTGRQCTVNYRRARIKQYPSEEKSIVSSCPVLSGSGSCLSCKYSGRSCYDCAQLVRAVLLAGGLPKVPSGASSLWSDDALWIAKGKLVTLGLESFAVLFRRDSAGSKSRPMAHCGVYCGGDLVIDARSSVKGVITSSIGAYKWTDYAVPVGCPVDAVIAPGAVIDADLLFDPAAVSFLSPSVRFGEAGEHVRALQLRLIEFSFPLPRYGADGQFGAETQAAVMACQHSHALPVTGVASCEVLSLLDLVSCSFI